MSSDKKTGGLAGVVAGETAISTVGKEGVGLTYRGYSINDLAEKATFEEIRRAFDKLNKRSAPERFPINSPERTQAAEIQKRIHWAYQMLTESLGTTEKRFRSLELE